MEDFSRHLERLGISIADSRAAADYGNARTKDELHYAAGEHLALHATSITTALRLPRRGSAILAVMKHAANSSWRRYWTARNDAFCLSALVDLCTVRSVFRAGKRWPDLAPLVNHVFVMACVYRGRLIEMSPHETERFREQATTHLIDFQDDDRRTHEEQIGRLMNLGGLSGARVDKAAFLKAAIVEPSWVDPWALMHHHDRIAGCR